MAYKKERNRYNKLLQFHKKQGMICKVMDNRKDTIGLFKLVNKLTNNDKDVPLLNRTPDVLAEEFATETKDAQQFRCFTPLASRQVYKTIMSMKSKSYELDTVPTHPLKKILPTCLDSITTIVNLSLTMGELGGE